MRSLSPVLAARQASEPVRETSRPEARRRAILAVNARLLLAAGGLGTPLALYALLQGSSLAFALCVCGLATGVLSLALHQRGSHESAAASQAYGLLLAGAVLAVADPAIADFGLAVTLLAPVHASLLARAAVQRTIWALTAGVAVLAGVAAAGLLAWPGTLNGETTLAGVAAFVVAAFAVAWSASRMGAVFEVHDKAQVNACRHLIEHVQDAVLRFSGDGGLLFASRSSEHLLGCRRYELSGNGLLERIHVLDRPVFLTAFANANRDGKSRRVELRMRRDDPAGPATAPQFVWVEAALSPVVDPDAPHDRHEVVALLRDVTERRDHESELQKARKLAEEASTAKSHFLATIGHELRTPLNAIVGFAEMMSSGVAGDLAPAHKEYASLIHQSGLHLIDVVQMLLDVSRLEAGKFELSTASFQPEALVEPCLTMVGALARAKQVRLATELAGVLPAIVADERACRQILINLLSNAIKFSHEHSVITVTMKRQGRYLNIAVADRGIGMNGEAVARIGEPFFQAQDGLARRYEGTGLGLSIVKGLVELHGGTLRAMSVPGEGTTMTVLLPVNGPETKVEETVSVTPLHRDPVPQQMPTWHDERKRAL